MGRATARAPIEKTTGALNVPLFRLLVEQLDAERRSVVLDLGAVSSPMLSLLAGSHCRVDIADLASDGGIERMNGATPGEDDLVQLAESLLPRRRTDDAVDIVLLWDLPNYLKPEAMSALMSAIAARARAGARAHALIVYSERSMPDRPGRFVPTEDQKLVNRAAAAAQIQAPRYSPESLGRIMGRFTIDQGRLLSNGMQEFLFRLQA